MINVLFMRSFNFSNNGINIINYKAGEKHQISDRCFEVANSLNIVEVIKEDVIVTENIAIKKADERKADVTKKADEEKKIKISELEKKLSDLDKKLDKENDDKEIKKIQKEIAKTEKAISELKK